MKIEFIKQPGGVLIPASDIEAATMIQFQNGEQYSVDIKKTRNQKFHRKVFKFFRFCFDHWRSELEFTNERKQFEVFRNNLTVVAGYYEEFYNIKGEVRVEAKSLSYESMDDLEFSECYSALINAAMRTIFENAGEDIEIQLYSFF